MKILNQSKVITEILSEFRLSVDLLNKKNNKIELEEVFNDFNDFIDFTLSKNISINSFLEKASYNASNDFLRILVENTSFNSVNTVIDKLLKENDSENIKSLFSYATNKINANDKWIERTKLIDKIINHVDNNKLWDIDFKNSMDISSPEFNKYLSDVGFYKLNSLNTDKILSYNQCFSLWYNLEKMVETEGVNILPLQTWLLIIGTAKEHSEKIPSSQLTDYAYDFFKQYIGDKDKVLYSIKNTDNQRVNDFSNNQDYIESAVNHYMLNYFNDSKEENLQNPSVITSVSINAINDFLDNVDDKFASGIMTKSKFIEISKNAVKNYLDYVVSDSKNIGREFTPVHKYYTVLKKHNVPADISNLVNALRVLKNSETINEEKRNINLKDTVLLFLDAVREESVFFKDFHFNEKLHLLKHIVSENIISPDVEDKNLNFLVECISQEFDKTSQKRDLFMKSIISIPTEYQKLFLTNVEVVQSVKSYIKNNMFSLNDFSHNNIESCDNLISFIMKNPEINNDLESWKFGSSSFFKKVLEETYFNASFINELNLNLDLAQNFKNKSKPFRVSLSESNVPGAKEILLSLSIGEKISGQNETNESDINFNDSLGRVNKL